MNASASSADQISAAEMSAGSTADRQGFEGFAYPARVQPHHTDYGGVVWHGTYLSWMESARVEYLRSNGLAYEDLVKTGCELPVVDLAMQFHRPARMGENLVVKVALEPIEGVRLMFDYSIESAETGECYTTACVTLVPIDRATGRVMRRWPPELVSVLESIATPVQEV